MNNINYESEFVKVGKNLSRLWGDFFSRKPKRVIRHVKNALRENRRERENHSELFKRLVGTILIWRHIMHVMNRPYKPLRVPERVKKKLLQSIARSFNYLLGDATIEDLGMLAYLRCELPQREGFDNPLLQLLELKILEFAVVDSTEVIRHVPELLFWKTIDNIESQWKIQYERLFRTYRLRIPPLVCNWSSA